MKHLPPCVVYCYLASGTCIIPNSLRITGIQTPYVAKFQSSPFPLYNMLQMRSVFNFRNMMYVNFVGFSGQCFSYSRISTERRLFPLVKIF